MKKIMRLYRKIVSLVIVAAIALNSAAVSRSAAETFDRCGLGCTYTLSDDGTLTISGTGTITKIFKDDDQIVEKIKKIVVEEGINKIGDECFCGLSYQENLEISLPDTLTEIGDSAFEYCSLEKVTLPDSVEEMGEKVFAKSSIREIRLSDNLKKIPSEAFSECEKLEKIEWSRNLEQIDTYAFYMCKLKKIKIPDSVKKVEDLAFYCCEDLEEITVGKSVKEISKKFISECYALKKIVNRSKISIPLDTLKGKRSWYVGKKKVTKLKPGKTAKAVYQKYKIKYKLDGGKIVGKKPKTYTYRQKNNLPAKVKKKGYTFLGWFVSAKNDWDYFPEYIPEKLYGNLTAEAIFKKYKVTSKDGKIKVTVKDKSYGKKGYKKYTDAYYFRYSENKDMSNPTVVVYTAPYGQGLSKKLEKGKTYYVQIARYLESYMEDSEDYEEPFTGWHCKRKVTIK